MTRARKRSTVACATVSRSGHSPTGAKITDRCKVHRVHQHHAVAVRGVVASLGSGGLGVIAARNLSDAPVRSVGGDSQGWDYEAKFRQSAREEFRRELRGGLVGEFGYGSRRGFAW